MLDLLIEYKQKRKELVKYREALQRKPMETEAEWTQLKAEKNEHEIIGGMIRDLEYAIEWMETSSDQVQSETLSDDPYTNAQFTWSLAH
ncbi:hypothetical protein [Geomicrobium sp. JCM 19038]|uniref:hypothetical protein n=1 Tax=Geomicrobium sp. JCM 19038 TaxID=1460635 RepID=UPI00045F1F3F|nr:hypothetical protein [Geomicrobium sp. JCM 19038]GAK09611.1 hypothetical protein JCM19038_3456 [Geomicrobium sp. JCM 19038]